MTKESGPNNAESQDQGAPSYEQAMAGAVAFSADEARARAEKRKQEKEQQEVDAKAAAEERDRQAKEKYEAWKEKERAAAEEKARQHQEAWEAYQGDRNFSEDIISTFMSSINEGIANATQNGEETADFTTKATIYYGPGYKDYEREGIASTLTGKEANGNSPDVVCSAAIDGVIDKEESNKEFDDDIRNLGTELMSQIKAKLEEAGYLVTADAKTGVITSVAWGEAAQPKPEPEPQSQPAPAKPKSPFARFLSRFGKKE